MKLIEPKVEFLKQGPGLEGIYKQIEIAGRTCYKSEANITPDSAKEFVERMIKSGHTAMLEHGTVYLDFGWLPWDGTTYELVSKYIRNKYSKVCGPIYGDVQYKEGERQYSKCFVTTNLRVLQENGWLDDLKYICEPTEYHERRITLRFQANIHFYKDATRHRKHSFAIESTRWINYMREKFGMSISFMMPSWIKNEDLDDFKEDCKTLENIYARWIGKGYKAECAAYFLCQGTAATVVMTAFTSDWKHFFDLRLFEKTGKVHPDMLLLAEKARKVLEENNLWYLIYKPNEN